MANSACSSYKILNKQCLTLHQKRFLMKSSVTSSRQYLQSCQKALKIVVYLICQPQSKIQVMLAVHNSISKISVQSKQKCQSSKISPSTHNTESLPVNSNRNHNVTISQNYWDHPLDSRRVTNLQLKISEMEQQEFQMEAKFQQCIESLLAEIQRNNNNNAKLASEVNNLKQQLTESRKDILIIEEYMKAGLKKEAKNAELHEPQKFSSPSPAKNLLASSSSAKNFPLRRTPCKYFRSKLLLKQ